MQLPSRSNGTPSAAAKTRERLTFVPSVFRIGEDVGHVNRRGLQRRSRHQRARAWRDRMLFRIFLIFRREAVVRG